MIKTGLQLLVLALVGVVVGVFGYVYFGRPAAKLLNFDERELASVSAKRALGHFRTATTSDIVFNNVARVALEPLLQKLGMPSDPERPWRTIAEVVNKDGRTAITCHMCHSGFVGDTFVGGLPNKHYDSRQFIELGDMFNLALWVTSDTATQASAAYVENVLLPLSEKNSHTIGTNVGSWAVYTTASMIKPHVDSMDEWVIDSPQFKRIFEITEGYFPVQHPRPWWLAKYSGRHFWADLTPHGADLSAADLALDLATPDFGNPDKYRWEDRWWISRDIQQYMDEISSPEYPGPIDQMRAFTGQRLYNKKCAGCHGKITSLGRNSYRYWRVDKTPEDYGQKVGTDPEYWNTMRKLSFAFTETLHTNKEFIRDGGVQHVPSKKRPKRYVVSAPPLIGVWASAPYLHNGAVPTLWDMLKPPHKRPKQYRLNTDFHAYDLRKVGVSYTIPTQVDPDDRYVYDTTRDAKWGMSNQGHEFGTKLSAADKWSLIEFLKGLGTDNVKAPPKGE